MKKLSSVNELNESIFTLSMLQNKQGELLKQQFGKTIELLKPENIIKKTVNGIVNSPDLVKSMISTSLGVTTGLLTKRIFIGDSGNLSRKLIGNIIQLGVITTIATHPDLVKTIGNKIINQIFKRSNTNQ